MNIRNPAIAAALLLLFTPAFGDEWRQPTVQNVFSPSGEYFVQLVPGTRPKSATAAGESGAAVSARGYFYVRQKTDRSYRLIAEKTLTNPIMPAFAKVTDAGELVTFDDWGSVGRGMAIVFYGPRGQHIRTVDIKELYSAAELRQLPSSKSTTMWRCDIYVSATDNGGAQLYVSGNAGASFLLDPKAGTVKRISAGASCGLPAQTF